MNAGRPAPRDPRAFNTDEAPTWLDWFTAHGWWTSLIAGGLLCAVAVALS